MKRKHRWARQAQVNGSRSHGPVTAEGKTISSQNALKSGLTSRKPVILQDENAAAFEELRAGYYLEFQPQGTVESDLVDEMVQSRWQLRRYLAMETGLLELERARTLADSQKTYNGLDPVGVLALAFKSLADNSHSLELLRRYHAGHGRDFRRALDTLLKLRSQRDPESPAEALSAAQAENRVPFPTDPSSGRGASPGAPILTQQPPAPAPNAAPNEGKIQFFPQQSENCETNPSATAGPVAPEQNAGPNPAPRPSNDEKDHEFRLIEFPTRPVTAETQNSDRENPFESEPR